MLFKINKGIGLFNDTYNFFDAYRYIKEGGLKTRQLQQKYWGRRGIGNEETRTNRHGQEKTG
jgi:hypothetical protein